jgi:hypothetical protein
MGTWGFDPNMSDQDIENLLWHLLQQNEVLQRNGYAVLFNEQGHVVIDRAGHVKGVWQAIDGVLAWTPAGYNEPLYKVADAKAAEQHTLVAFGLV